MARRSVRTFFRPSGGPGEHLEVYGGIFLSKIRFIPLRIHKVALKPIFCLRFRGCYLSMGV